MRKAKSSGCTDYYMKKTLLSIPVTIMRRSLKYRALELAGSVVEMGKKMT